MPAGQAAFLSLADVAAANPWFDFWATPRVRYCVEMAAENVTALFPGRGPRTTPPSLASPDDDLFADYVSCNPRVPPLPGGRQGAHDHSHDHSLFF